MKTLVRHLIAEERRIENDSGQQNLAGFQICEKLRRPLCTFTGVAGFRALLSRAMVLAKAKAPLLDGVQIMPDGTFLYSDAFKAQLTSDDAARAGEALAKQLLGLLVIFIGEALTLRLVHDVWPKAATTALKSRGNTHEK